MSLTGTLHDLSLADLLGLFVLEGRSGVVRIHHDGRSGAVWVTGGAICCASSDLSRAELVRRIASAGALDAGQVRAALAQESPVRALAGLCDRDLVRRVAADQCLDALADLLGWPDGHYDIAMGVRSRDDLGLRLPILGAVATAAARAARWRTVRAGLPPAGSVLRLRPDVAGHRVLTPSQWRVVAHIDGVRDIAAVLELAGSSLSAAAALVELVAAGLVIPAGEVAHGEPRAVTGVIRDFERTEAVPGFPAPRDLGRPASAGSRGVEPVWVAPAARGTPGPGDLSGDDPAAASQGWPQPRRRRASHAAPGYVGEDSPGSGRVAGAGAVPRRSGEPGGPDSVRHPGEVLHELIVDGATAVHSEVAEPDERAADGLSRSLLMQLIAGVRGL